MGELGRVHEVSAEEFGSVLTADHAAAVTVLNVKSAVDFDEKGGTLSFIDPADSAGSAVLTATYTKADKDANTVTLAAGLAVALDQDHAINVVGIDEESDYVAQVMIEDEDEPVTARIPDFIRRHLPEGIREEAQREGVRIEEDEGGEVYVAEVYGLAPPQEVVQSPVTAAAPYAAKLTLRAGTNMVTDPPMVGVSGDHSVSGGGEYGGDLWAYGGLIVGLEGLHIDTVTYGRETTTTNASGEFTVNHLGDGAAAPAVVLITAATTAFRLYSVISKGVSSFTVTARNDTGALFGSGTSVDIYWLALWA